MCYLSVTFGSMFARPWVGHPSAWTAFYQEVTCDIVLIFLVKLYILKTIEWLKWSHKSTPWKRPNSQKLSQRSCKKSFINVCDILYKVTEQWFLTIGKWYQLLIYSCSLFWLMFYQMPFWMRKLRFKRAEKSQQNCIWTD